MDISPLVHPDLKLVQSYGEGFFRVNGAILRSDIIVSDKTVTEWGYQTDKSIVENIQRVLPCLSTETEILLIGTGKTSPIMLHSQRKNFSGLGIKIDVMDTPSACRTYNILTAEGRRVAVALVRL